MIGIPRQNSQKLSHTRSSLNNETVKTLIKEKEKTTQKREPKQQSNQKQQQPQPQPPAQIDRRLDSNSAKQLARRVFAKYDSNSSGFLNSMEASQLISDLYASINVEHPPSEKEGLQFMIANDVNNDNEFCMKDFEEVFVRHLSTGDSTGHRLFFEKPMFVSTTHQKSRNVLGVPTSDSKRLSTKKSGLRGVKAKNSLIPKKLTPMPIHTGQNDTLHVTKKVAVSFA